MTLKTLRKRLATEAEKAGICDEWRRKILKAPSREYLLQLFIKGLDFAILNDFPGDELAAEFDDIAPAYGIFLNREGSWGTDNRKHIIVRDAVVTPANYDGFSVGEVYALHGGAVEVIARGYAVVCVSVETGGRVIAKAYDNARVKIIRHGGEIKTRQKDKANIKVINP